MRLKSVFEHVGFSQRVGQYLVLGICVLMYFTSADSIFVGDLRHIFIGQYSSRDTATHINYIGLLFNNNLNAM